MFMNTINVEYDVRRRYNRRVLCCVRIKGAALLIGLWDLLIHAVALYALVVLFERSGRTDVDTLPMASADPYHRSPSNLLLDDKNFRSSNILLSRILEMRNSTQALRDINARHIYSHMDSMTIRWVKSLSQQDKCIVVFVVLSATILILAHIWGVLINKPSYIFPYFLVKVFNVVISILSTLGFYAYLPDITGWLRMQSTFPLKQYLLELDGQTLQLVIFAALLFIIVAKLYIAAIIWYCYGYITAISMARTIGTITAHTEISQGLVGHMYSPPKYEEAIKSTPFDEDNYAPPPYTPLLSS